ncbi:hypothetical protein [Sphingobium sp.]|uniref:hypothetical protein n=1 Tax=Sphingobium sp. TaxID=1912891 RepID=UPI002B8377FE|nr:hypothetical protein [Sphingobium sp.]HUD92308.1 hypothetical protein [Sphingobium sp.]
MRSTDLLTLEGQLATVEQAGDKDECRFGGCLGHLPFLAGDRDGFTHVGTSSSVSGSPTIAEAGEGSILPRGCATRFLRLYPDPDIEPYQGWALCCYLDDDNDGFTRLEYVARGPERDVHLPVSRFAFTPTQARFEWLVRNGFQSKATAHCTGPWDDHDIDAQLAAEGRAVAA